MTIATETYGEWIHNTIQTVKKDTLMTLAYIHEHRTRDSNRAYSSQQLDDVKDAVCILHELIHIKKLLMS